MPKLNVLFILIDGMRSDQFFGSMKTSKTPNIDSLIKKGAYFTQAISSVDGTILSLNSIFTGHFPFQTGIRAKKLLLKENNFLEIFKKNGYHICGLVPNLTSFLPLIEYFENNENTFYEGPPPESLGTSLTKKVVNFLESEKSRTPWFYYLHLFDLHPLREGKSSQGIENFNNEIFGSSPYERTVSSIDFWLGKIFQHIDFSNTITIITADHGERIPYENIRTIDFEPKLASTVKFGKKVFPKSTHQLGGKFLSKIRNTIVKARTKKASKNLTNYQKRSRDPYFTLSLFDELIHIPLLFVGDSINSRIINQPVRHIDIFPTICELIDIKYQIKTMHGRSLVPMIQGKEMDEEPIYLHTMPYQQISPADLIGIRTNNYKYFRSAGNKTENVNLYDLIHDPYENNNIAHTSIHLVEQFEHILTQIQKDSLSDHKEEEISEQEMKRIENELKRLGYI